MWCAYITYIPVQGRFLSLTAIMDCASRWVRVWPLSNTSETEFCLASVAIEVYGIPETFNTVQESKFTDIAFTDLREAGTIRCWMDGRGRRRLEHAFIERLRCSFEAVYLHELANGFVAQRVIDESIKFYNAIRQHSALGGRTPFGAHRGLAARTADCETDAYLSFSLTQFGLSCTPTHNARRHTWNSLSSP